MSRNNERLAKLKAQRAILEARIQAAEARAKTIERKQETRRKILIGAYYLEQSQQPHEQEALKARLAGYLTRASDRALFDLPPLDAPTAQLSK